MVQIKRLWAQPDFRRFVAIALGVFLGYMLLAYGWGFFLTEDALVRDAAGAVGMRAVSDIETTDIGDARILTFAAGEQYGYASYVKHPIFPLYKRTEAYLDYKPIAADGDTVYVEDFSKTYLIGQHTDGLAEVKSYDYSTLGFNWPNFVIWLGLLALALYTHNRFMRSSGKDGIL